MSLWLLIPLFLLVHVAADLWLASSDRGAVGAWLHSAVIALTYVGLFLLLPASFTTMGRIVAVVIALLAGVAIKVAADSRVATSGR